MQLIKKDNPLSRFATIALYHRPKGTVFYGKV